MPCSPRALLATALVCWCACVILGLAAGAPLTSDEAAYALLAKGVDATWLYRPIGFVGVAKLGVALGGGDFGVRLPCAITSPLLLVGAAALGRRFGPWTGAATAAVLASTHTLALRAPELLDDIPSTTCLVWALVVVTGELAREGGPRWRLVGAAPLLAAAFYLRYGTAPAIVLIAVAALVAWRREVRARPGPVIATVVAFAALLVPFALYSRATTGSVTGILEISGEVSGRLFIGQGLQSYLRNNPWRLYGIAITPVLFAGIAGLVRPAPPTRRLARFLGVVALGQVFALGIVSHASTRFVFLPMVLLAIVGVDFIDRALRRPGLRCAAGIGVVLACAVMVTAMVPLERTIARGLASTIAAARAIRADAAGRPCTVVARATPQLMWYSGCGAYKIRDASAAVPLAPGTRWYAASAPRRPIDPAALGAASHAEAIGLVPGAWRLEPR